MISAIVPTVGARARLERHLPSVCTSLEASGQPWEVIVVDDGAGLETAPAPARLVSQPGPRGYGPAVNAGAAAAGGDLLLVLNDDVELEPSTVRLLRDALLPEEGVFAVAPRIVSPLARCGDEGGKSGTLRAGLLEVDEVPAEAPHPTLYPVGCCFLCRRQAFLALGGFDDVYAPFFWEDVDLGYRAWRSGLASVHVPGARSATTRAPPPSAHAPCPSARGPSIGAPRSSTCATSSVRSCARARWGRGRRRRCSTGARRSRKA